MNNTIGPNCASWFLWLSSHFIVCCTYCSDPELIYLTDGASKGVMQMLNAIIRNGRDGVWLSLKSRIFPPNFYAISAED
jgi:hypothetical protein